MLQCLILVVTKACCEGLQLLQTFEALVSSKLFRLLKHWCLANYSQQSLLLLSFLQSPKVNRVLRLMITSLSEDEHLFLRNRCILLCSVYSRS